jgi:hypothetical protein
VDSNQGEVLAIYRSINCRYYQTQTRSHSSDEGIPDFIVFHEGRGLHWYHEIKTPTGKLSKKQLEFRRLCARTGTGHLVGGKPETMEFLKKAGILV